MDRLSNAVDSATRQRNADDVKTSDNSAERSLELLTGKQANAQSIRSAENGKFNISSQGVT
jgi:hypothetical protein